jgi:hypothetical protein
MQFYDKSLYRGVFNAPDLHPTYRLAIAALRALSDPCAIVQYNRDTNTCDPCATLSLALERAGTEGGPYSQFQAGNDERPFFATGEFDEDGSLDSINIMHLENM